MANKQSEIDVKNRFSRGIVILILVFGVCVILYSVYLIVTNFDNINVLILGLVMIGVSFAAIWFGVTHFDIQSSENKIQNINERVDKIKEILDRK
ncbi:MAG: hypothetical protein ABR887_03205 [Methanoregulaceae archaeon]|jgi:hypothetical protein